MSRRFLFFALVGAVAAVAAVTATSGSAHTSTGSVTALPSSSCGPLVYKGTGKPDFIIPSDLPLQGAIRKQTVEISQAMVWALAHAGWRAGKYKIAYQSCDDSTAQTGGWDTAKCATNAALYKKYQELADSAAGVHFLGRLGTYKYYNMDQVVAQALTLYSKLAGQPRRDAVASLA